MHKSFSPYVMKSTKSIIIFYSMGLEENIFRGINVCGMANDFLVCFQCSRYIRSTQIWKSLFEVFDWTFYKMQKKIKFV